MRDILFRGRTENKKKWFEGYYTLCGYHIGTIEEEIYPTITPFNDWPRKVDLKTVGQFTGLFDKNGKRIFEGDVVAYCWYEAEPMNFRIEFVSGEFLAVPVKKREDVWAIRISGQGENLEVIGNIHDNPELLEVDNG